MHVGHYLDNVFLFSFYIDSADSRFLRKVSFTACNGEGLSR